MELHGVALLSEAEAVEQGLRGQLARAEQQLALRGAAGDERGLAGDDGARAGHAGSMSKDRARRAAPVIPKSLDSCRRTKSRSRTGIRRRPREQ